MLNRSTCKIVSILILLSPFSSSLSSKELREKLKSPRRSHSSSRRRKIPNADGSTTEESFVAEERKKKRSTPQSSRSSVHSGRSSSKHRHSSRNRSQESSKTEVSGSDQLSQDTEQSNQRNRQHPYSSPSGRGRKVISVSNSPNEKFDHHNGVQPGSFHDESWASGMNGHPDSHKLRTSTPLVNGNYNTHHTPNTPGLPNFDDTDQTGQSHPSVKNHTSTPNASFSIPPALPYAMPDPPQSIGIEKIMGRRSLILKWTPPELDIVRNYRVFKSYSMLTNYL